METPMRRSLCLVMLVLYPGLALAAPDPVKPDDDDTVPLSNLHGDAQGFPQNSQAYVQNAQSNLANGNALGQQAMVGSPAYGQMTGAFQQYQNNMSMVIASQPDTKKFAAEYTHILDEATQAAKEKDPAEQVHLFGNYLHDSRIFLINHPDATQLWVMRAVAALRLNKPATGIQAGQILSALPPKDRTDPHIKRLLDVLEKQGWIPNGKAAEAKANPGPSAGGKPPK
jgi:hypothetical protein